MRTGRVVARVLRLETVPSRPSQRVRGNRCPHHSIVSISTERVIRVGHRAIVASERDDGAFDLHYSHWGALDGPSVAADRSGRNDGHDPDRCARDLFDRLGVAAHGFQGRLGRSNRSAVDPDHLAAGVDFETVLDEYLDVGLHEALFVVSRSGTVRPFIVLALDIEPLSRADHGVLVELDPEAYAAEVERFRGWIDGSKAVLAAAADRGLLDEPAARSLLADQLFGYVADERAVVPV
ncbi:MAG: hypothetical protein ACI9YT_000592 [Halobacteriales archaeon]|jgi:hypothetical protein